MKCFHMTSRRPYWCPKTMKRRPYWCPKPIFWKLNSFLMQTVSFVPINLHRCWLREWKHSIKDRKGKCPSANLNKFLILRGEDWNWWCVLSVFEKFRFRLSTGTRENSVFKKFPGKRLRKVPFSLIVFIAYVWTEVVSVKKKLRFQMKTDTCWQGLRLAIQQLCTRFTLFFVRF